MAKKEKIELTPEELEAKETRSKEKRGIFGNTFVKSMAALLALLLVYSIAYIAFGKSPATVAAGPGKVETTKSDSDDSGSDDSEGPAETTAAAGDSAGTTAAGDKTPAGTTAAAKDNSAADAVKAINEATAKAAKMQYDWTRNCKYTKDIDVGGATGTLNTIIKGIDPKADLNGVVGGFIGIGNKDNKGKKVEDIKDSYRLKATSLTAADIKITSVKDGVYSFTVSNTKNPQKDGKTALSRLTNDFITKDEVVKGIKDALGKSSALLSVQTVDGNYKSIKVVATIKDGNLQSMKIDYDFDAALDLKATFVPIHGTGAAHATINYSNFR
ncbi:MAG: hypothetical protein RSB11_01945 [Oscillospiraceae bacterium]